MGHSSNATSRPTCCGPRHVLAAVPCASARCARARPYAVRKANDVTGGVESVGCAQSGVNDDSPGLVQLDAFEKVRGGPHARSDDDHIRLDTLAIVECDRFDV